MATKHGDRPKGKRKRLYHIWLSMRERCNNPNHNQYIHYGGRGIGIYEQWDDYKILTTPLLTKGGKVRES